MKRFLVLLITICLLIILSGCSQVFKTLDTILDETTPSQNISISKELLKTNDILDMRDVIFPINTKWKFEELVTDDYSTCYSFDDFFISYSASITTDDLCDYFLNNILENKDYSEQTTEDVSFNTLIYCTGTKATYIGKDNEYTNCLFFDYEGNFYDVYVSCSVSNKSYADTLMDNITRGTITKHPTYWDNIINNSDGDSSDNYSDDDYLDETTVAPTKPTKKTIYNPSSVNNFTANGSGDYVAKGLEVENFAILNITVKGNDGNFAVTSYKDGKYQDLLVNEIGDYTGTVLIDETGSYQLEVQCDSGNWSISASNLVINEKTSFSGTGDAVTGITSHCGGSWKFTHTGSDNFAVVEYGVNYGYLELLVNEIGNYSGSVMTSDEDEAVFFKISADGAWTIEQE